MAGLTQAGLEIKRFEDVREDLRLQANTIFADLVPEGDLLDTSSASTLGRLIGVLSPSEADLWEALQQVYTAFDPNSAEGVALDNLAALAGIVRRSATSSTARLLLTGDYNITIPQGSVVSSSYTNNKFEIPSQVLLDENGVVGIVIQIQSVQNSTAYTITYNDGANTADLTYTSDADATELEILTGLADAVNSNYGSILTATVIGATLQILTDDSVTQTSYTISGNLFFTKSIKGVTVVATETGEKEQDTGTIDTISTPVFGWDSIQQISPATVGSLRETDTDLRLRFNDAKYTRGSNISDALYSDLISLDGVTDIRIYENLTNAVDSFGIPPHAFMTVVRGGLDSDIAETIWKNRPAGIPTHGNTVYLITDVFGNLKEVYFQRPTFVDIYVTVNITTDETFPVDGAEQIKNALFDYIKNQSNVGEKVTYSRLYTPINSVEGHQVDSLFIGTSASPTGTSNIALAFDEIAKLEVGNIEVNIA